jgi:hypothetical protein
MYRVTVGFLPSRSELPELLNRRKLFGCGAEVGVAAGGFSDWLLRGWRGAHLISVDPWREASSAEYDDVRNTAQAAQDETFEEAKKRLAEHGKRSSVWRMTSSEASERLPNHSLDFVYIDARHDYESVLEDLELWLDKIRPGGLIAGHDYVDGRLPTGLYGVKSAVDEFFGCRGLPVASTFMDEAPTWIVHVPYPGTRPSRAAWGVGVLVRGLAQGFLRLRGA